MWRSSTIASGDPTLAPRRPTRSSTPALGRSLSSAVALTNGSGSGGSIAMSPSAAGGTMAKVSIAGPRSRTGRSRARPSPSLPRKAP